MPFLKGCKIEWRKKTRKNKIKKYVFGLQNSFSFFFVQIDALRKGFRNDCQGEIPFEFYGSQLTHKKNSTEFFLNPIGVLKPKIRTGKEKKLPYKKICSPQSRKKLDTTEKGQKCKSVASAPWPK